MGFSRKSSCKRLLRNSKAMKRIDTSKPEEIFDRKNLYSNRLTHDIQSESLFRDTYDNKEKINFHIYWKWVIVGVVILFIVTMVLLLVL